MRGMAPKTGYHHGDLRNALVAAARTQIEESGEDGFSLREAARAVGVSANAAYRHFGDKSELLTALAVQGFEELGHAMQRAESRASRSLRDEPSVARFKATGRAYVSFALAHPELFRLMFGVNGLRCITGVVRPSPSPYERLGAALDGLVDAGQLTERARKGAELKAWTIVHGFATLVLEGAQSFDSRRQRDAALESVLELAVAGLAAR